MENAITLKFDGGKLPKTEKRKTRSGSQSIETCEPGRIPRITHLMALAINFKN